EEVILLQARQAHRHGLTGLDGARVLDDRGEQRPGGLHEERVEVRGADAQPEVRRVVKGLVHGLYATAPGQPPIESRHSGVGRVRTGVARAGGEGLPAEDGRAPGQAGAEAAEHQQGARLDAPLAPGLVDAQRDGGRRSVAVALDVVVHLVPRDVQHVDRRVDDADVRLVRDVQVDVAGPQTAGVQYVLNGIAQDVHGPAKDRAAVHVHVLHALVQEL